MSFADCAAMSFTRASVQKNAPDCSGVYGLSNGREWVFIGEGDSIRSHLLGHLNDLDAVLKTRAPTGFSFEVCAPKDRTARQEMLVRRLKPFYNTRLEPAARR